MRYIRIARNNKMITEVTFRNQIITTVSQIENIYWDLVNAYENVTVQQRALDLANKTLSDNQKQVAAGTLAPLTVVQSQSAVASAKQNLIAAQVNLQLQQLLMKNAITRNMADPFLAVAPVIPTDTLEHHATVRGRLGGRPYCRGVKTAAGDHDGSFEPHQQRGYEEVSQEPTASRAGFVCVLWSFRTGWSGQSVVYGSNAMRIAGISYQLFRGFRQPVQ